MIRSLKTLGPALVTMLALAAVLTSAVSAAPKLTPVPEEYPVTVKGAQTVTNILELEGTRATECETATIEGTINSKAAAEESNVTVSPAYANCTTTILGNKDPATYTMNGCTFKLTNTETASGAIASEGWESTGKEVHLQCPAGSLMELHVFASKEKDEKNEPLCTYHIAPQTPGGDLDYKLTEKNPEGAGTSGDIKLTLTGVAITKTSGTLTNCGPEKQTAMLTGEIKYENFNASGVLLRSKLED
ncbi:MAG TPA: hypothetical protein VHA54_04320 [Solirubrobacterales bacterium]|nr:hypothetical protein [Solirubrobacterales bacterium]